ncbi:MAG: diguanylate cyclase [Acidobacteriota bacterium]|nr:diguanylate cyclase [Acidobacteriota bacterium]
MQPVWPVVFVACICLLGVFVFLKAWGQWNLENWLQFVCYLILVMVASGLKVGLPSLRGTMSVAFLFTLIAVEELNLPQTLVIACTATLVQCLWQAKRRPKPVQVGFNVACIAIAADMCWHLSHWPALRSFGLGEPLVLVVVASSYFFLNTFPIAAVIALTERKHLARVWKETFFWSFPYYLVGAAIAGLIRASNHIFSWQLSLLALPVMYLIYRSYRVYLDLLRGEKLHAEEQKLHAEDMASLHLRTIEALALAIEAKDHTTHRHLQRVQGYAVELGKELGLTGIELEALRAAAVLHDIGKLAVPEHIISKPGKLTPEEFERMKIHPSVGAEILEQVKFPYPVVPLVRAHHEKWDGSGYPYGLKGLQIPIGARILSVVDCLDAIASDRQYRRALPLDEAMDVVRSESGKAFDPQVVEVLGRRYREWEILAGAYHVEGSRLSTDVRIENGEAPAAGFENPGKSGQPAGSRNEPVNFLQHIASARQEVQMLFEMSQDLGNSLSLNETLSVLAVRLKKIIPHDSIAIYIQRDGKLIPEYVSGDDFRLFSSLQIPVGQGLSGWVAANKKWIINGNPSVEPGYLNDPAKFSTLRSALAVPLEGLNGVVGVLAVYHAEKDAFTSDHLRVLLALSSKVSLSIENALKFRQVESSATTDYLTSLPNARSLFLHLDAELARCKRAGTSVAVLVCDLDGFKQVNDRFGHLEGNKVLQAVAKGLAEGCREYDYVARMGGDEFVLIFPGLEEDAVRAKAEQLCKTVALRAAEICADSPLGLSIGAASYPRDGMDAEGLLAEADRRMYTTKQKHRMSSIATLQVSVSDQVPALIQ